jgi:hypothetical protein
MLNLANRYQQIQHTEPTRKIREVDGEIDEPSTEIRTRNLGCCVGLPLLSCLQGDQNHATWTSFDPRHVIAPCYAAPMVLVDPRHRRGSSRRESQMGLIDWYLSLREYWYLSFLIISGNRVTQRPASFFVKFKMERRDKRFTLWIDWDWK